MNNTRTFRWVLIVIAAVAVGLIGWLAFVWLGCPSLDEKGAKDILRGRSMSEISSIQIRANRGQENYAWALSDEDQVAAFFDLLLRDRTVDLLAGSYIDGVEVTFVFNDTRQYDLAFAMFAGGVYFGDECRSHQESGWLVPAAGLFEWVMQGKNLSSYDTGED